MGSKVVVERECEYACDRCGVVARGTGEPAGWFVVRVDSSVVDQSRLLCSMCIDGYRIFLIAGRPSSLLEAVALLASRLVDSVSDPVIASTIDELKRAVLDPERAEASKIAMLVLRLYRREVRG